MHALFRIGYFLKPLQSALSRSRHLSKEVGLLVVSVALIFLCGHENGYVWMYLCGYGNNFVLYLLGGVAGVLMLYVVSLWLSRLPYRSMMTEISKGSILIIGLHIIIVRRLMELPDRWWCEDLFFSVLILLAFVPIVRLAGLFFPILLGRHQV